MRIVSTIMISSIAISWIALITIGATNATASVGARMAPFPDIFPNLFLIDSEGYSRAQTFTSDRNGILGSIEVVLGNSSSDPQGGLADEIFLQIRETRDGAPGGIDSLLGRVSRSSSELDYLTPFRSVAFDFSPLAIEVRRGQMFALVFAPGTGVSIQMPSSLRRPPLDLYVGGSAYSAAEFGDEFVGSDRDWGFSFTVVPEPGPLLLLGLGIAGLSLVGRSRSQLDLSSSGYLE